MLPSCCSRLIRTSGKAGEATLESRRNKLAPDPNSEGQERASGLQTGGSSLLDDDPSRLRVRTDVAPASWLTTARDAVRWSMSTAGPSANSSTL